MEVNSGEKSDSVYLYIICPGSSTDRMSDSGSDDWGSNPHRDTRKKFVSGWYIL